MIVYGVCAGYDIKYGVVAFLTEDEGPHVEMYQYYDDGLRLLKDLKIKTQNSQKAVFMMMRIELYLFLKKESEE